MGSNSTCIHGTSHAASDGCPLVSLVIPVFNAGKYLAECLASIQEQTFRDFEVTVVDDGSTDSSLAITESVCKSDHRFKLVKPGHGGVSKARNTGINLSRGKYIGFVDADDCLHPEALESLVNTLETTDAQVCVGGFERGLDFRPKTVTPKPPLVMDYVTAMREALYQSLILNSPCGMLMERELLGNDIRFREGIRYEDLDAFYRFYERATRIAYLPATIYFYRQAQESFMHQWSPGRVDVLDVTDRMVEHMSTYHPDLAQAAKDRRFSAHFNLFLLMSRLNTGSAETRQRCLNVIRQGRMDAIRDPKVRIKNKLGALASFGGVAFLKLLSRLYR